MLSVLIYYNPAFKFNRLASANRSYCDIFFNRDKSFYRVCLFWFFVDIMRLIDIN